MFFQIATILCIIILIFLFYFSLRKDDPMEERTGQEVWMIRCRRIAPTSSGILRRMLMYGRADDEAELPEGSFYLGNNILLNDIVLNVRDRIRLYLNVQPDKVLLTVLKGKVQISGYTYYQDSAKQIVIRDHMEVSTNEAKLIFKRRWVN